MIMIEDLSKEELAELAREEIARQITELGGEV